MKSIRLNMLLLCLIFFVVENILLVSLILTYSFFYGASFHGRWYNIFLETLVDITLVRAVFILPFYLGGFLFTYQRYSLKDILARMSSIIVLINVLILTINPYIAEKGFVQYLIVTFISWLSLYLILLGGRRIGVII